MAIAWAELTQGAETTTEPSTTAEITPTSGAVVYAAVIIAQTNGTGIDVGTLDITGCGLTWAVITSQIYATRRRLFVVRGTGTPSTGTLSLDWTTTGTWTETMWSIDEATGVDAGDPDDAPQVNSTASAEALAVPDVGTPGTDDAIYAAFGIEDDKTASLTVDDGTILTSLGGGDDCRHIVAFYDANHSDETPSIAWTTNAGAGGIGFIVNADAGGGPAASSLRPALKMRMGVGR